MSTNQLGLSKEYAVSMSEKLNGLLADVQVFYMNLRGFHWNIKGKMFFSLHEKFEDLYDEAADQADEIAERVLMLGETPVHAFSEYLKIADFKEIKNVSGAEETVKHVVSSLQALVKKEKSIIETASEEGDEGTVDLLTGFVSGREKMIWMYNSFLK